MLTWCKARRIRPWLTAPLTVEDGADNSPGGGAGPAGVLAHRRLQDEEGKGEEEESEAIRDEEGTWKTQRADEEE